MYILVLIISLKSQFNHALDVKIQDKIETEHVCQAIAEETIAGLKYYDKDVNTKYFCKLNTAR
jgi:hypothetical protein